MAGWYCADCGGKILLDNSGELGLKLVCLHCDAELEVVSIDPPEVDWAYDWDREEEGASIRVAFPHDLQEDQAEGMRGRLVLQSLSGSVPWR
jgi:lysine biosynthesis protein LysW